MAQVAKRQRADTTVCSMCSEPSEDMEYWNRHCEEARIGNLNFMLENNNEPPMLSPSGAITFIV